MIEELKQLIDVCNLIIGMLIVACPKDTRNLVNSIGYKIYDDSSIAINIGGANAPYAAYTNEEWIHERWNGAQNPNEGWINRVMDQVTLLLAERGLGEVYKYTREVE